MLWFGVAMNTVLLFAVIPLYLPTGFDTVLFQAVSSVNRL